MKQSDIYLMQFPFATLDGTKVRPSLILSTHKKLRNNVIVCALGSKNNNNSYIPITRDDLASGRLRLQTFVQYEKVFTIAKQKVLWKVGTLSEKKFLEVQQELIEILT